MSIESINARMIYDSRGNPTTEVSIETHNGIFTSSCPSGASTGSEEAFELRDNEKAHHGKGVQKALKNIEKILSPALIGKSVLNQKELDDLMIKLDGTENKRNLGANAILPISMSICRAAAAEMKIPLFHYISLLLKTENKEKKTFKLPMPFFNIINGGEHAGNEIPIQEFMIAPINAKSFKEAMRMSSEVYATLKNLLKQKFGIASINVGDEGGFAPLFNSPRGNEIEEGKESGKKSIEIALDLICEAIKVSGYEGQIEISMDAAATSFFNSSSNKYNPNYKHKNIQIRNDPSNLLSSSELVSFYSSLIKKYPIHSIEDPLAEEDWKGFALATEKLSVKIVGDDILVTNPKRIKKAIEKKACNSLLLKLNQIGTVSEAIEAVRIAKVNGWKVMTSHRSGETVDDFIADLSVGLGTEAIKSGAPCRGERLAKYNRLMKIEEELEKEGIGGFWSGGFA